MELLLLSWLMANTRPTGPPLTHDWGGGGIFCPGPLVFSRYLPKLQTNHCQTFITLQIINLAHPDKRKIVSSNTSAMNDVRITPCFPGFRQKYGFAGNAATHTALQIKPIGFQQEVENELVYQTALSDFQNCEKYKNVENNQKIKYNIRFLKKNPEHMWRNPDRCICVQKLK